MNTVLAPYLNFKDNTREAMEFYTSIFGGQLELHTFKEYNASQDPSEDNKIMHAMLKSGNIMFMAADTPNSMEFNPGGTTMHMSLSGDNDAELSGFFDKLSDGGKVYMPLQKAQWGDKFGMCYDKFGISWMVNISLPKE